MDEQQAYAKDGMPVYRDDEHWAVEVEAEAQEEQMPRMPGYAQELKQAVIDGEGPVGHHLASEQWAFQGLMRGEQATVDEDYEQVREDLHDHFLGYQRGDDPRTFEEVEPHYRWGWEVGRSAYYADRDFDEIEPELRHEYGRAGYSDDEWEELREEIRAGWERARG